MCLITVLTLTLLFLWGTANAQWAPLIGASNVAAGAGHSCAVSTGGGVKCWGRNAEGQLGDGSNTYSNIPTTVSGLGTGVHSVSAGGHNTCALTTGGAVKCWGFNWLGELGNGVNGPDEGSNIPVDVSGLDSGVVAIGVGSQHICALTAQGGIKCWGGNYYGQLGNGYSGSSAYSNVPVDVDGLNAGVQSISVGGTHTCALLESGAVKCWGYNYYGQLGTDNYMSSSVPVDVVGLDSGAQQVSTGDRHTCALTTNGALKCWGWNAYGTLGNGEVWDSDKPVDVVGMDNGVTQISAGSEHTCALIEGNAVKCWGSNVSGQLGNGNYGVNATSTVPVEVSGLDSGVQAINVGYGHTCALIADGKVKCWGDNVFGQLGNGGALLSVPVDVIGLGGDVQGISTGGGYHTCIVTESGEVRCWGNNSHGQLGDGSLLNADAPVVVSDLAASVRIVEVGYQHSCALTTGGAVWCWGRNDRGQLGDGSNSNSSTPVEVFGLSDALAISAGDSHTCALRTGGGVTCWGGNSLFQTGVPGLESDVQAISAGAGHTCALTTGGAVKCWGANWNGQLGDGSFDNSADPVDVVGLGSGVQAISAGVSHTCAVISGGTAQCWGWNRDGQLGDGSYGDSSVPTDVVGLGSGVQSISAGDWHSCALTSLGSVKCWGDNGHSQLGDGSVVDSYVPVDVSGLGSGVQTLSIGDRHTCALTTDNRVKCWGTNYYGALGDGNAWFTSPVHVVEPDPLHVFGSGFE